MDNNTSLLFYRDLNHLISATLSGCICSLPVVRNLRKGETNNWKQYRYCHLCHAVDLCDSLCKWNDVRNGLYQDGAMWWTRGSQFYSGWLVSVPEEWRLCHEVGRALYAWAEESCYWWKVKLCRVVQRWKYSSSWWLMQTDANSEQWFNKSDLTVIDCRKKKIGGDTYYPSPASFPLPSSSSSSSHSSTFVPVTPTPYHCAPCFFSLFRCPIYFHVLSPLPVVSLSGCCFHFRFCVMYCVGVEWCVVCSSSLRGVLLWIRSFLWHYGFWEVHSRGRLSDFSVV